MVVKRSTYDAMVLERDEWRMRAEAMARLAQAAVPPAPPKRRVWPAVLAAFWLMLAGLFIGVAVPKAQGPTLSPDMSACIGQARYEHPVEGNQYQELVNALWDCEVFQ